MQRGIHHLLRMPERRRHVLDLARLVVGHHLLGRLEARCASEQCPEQKCAAAVSPTAAEERRVGGCTHEGSVMPIAWRTRPIYVSRSYCEAGSSRVPGSEADMMISGGVEAVVVKLVFAGTAVFGASRGQRRDIGERGRMERGGFIFSSKNPRGRGGLVVEEN